MKPLLLLGVLIFGASACTTAPASNRETGAVTGAVLGAGAGAVVGHEVGHTGAGAAIGAGSGAIVGGLVGNAQDLDEAHSKEQDKTLERQEKELTRQQNEIEDLRRQEYWDREYRKFDPHPEGTLPTNDPVPVDEISGNDS